MNRPTISVVIPALNEESNIARILQAFINQKVKSARYEKIYVLSDGSSDNTNEIVRSFTNKKVQLKAYSTRKGKSFRLNQIFKEAQEDILLVVDADIQPENELLVEKIARKITRDPEIGIVSGDTISYTGITFIEKVIAHSHDIKRDIYRRINKGNNIYHCHGRIRGFSKNFYKILRIPADCPEDAYSFLSCIDNGFKFAFLQSARVYFYSPRTFDDHLKQSTRFYTGRESLLSYFSERQVKEQYFISPYKLIISLVKAIIDSPVKTISYIALNIYIRFVKSNIKVDQSLWEISETSKGGIV